MLSDFDNYQWLVSNEAQKWLTEGVDLGLPPYRLVEKLRKSLTADRARLVAKQVALREKGIEKFGPLSRQMFFTERALQQATDLGIAKQKACRFAVDKQALDYCSGIGGDLLALAERGPVVGLDLDPIMTVLAKANLRVWELHRSASVKIGLAEDYPPEANSQWHLDPDRRVEGRRSTRPQWHSPSEAIIEEWLQAAPHGAIKFAPAAELSTVWQERAELEWITRARSCRQLVAWFGDLAETPGQRRATLISNEGTNFESASFIGDPDCQTSITERIGDYVFDTDPAIRAAGLTGSLARELGCEAVSPGAAYLTKDCPLTHSLVSCFRVVDVVPMRVQKLAQYLRMLDIGKLEIKTRGVSVSPEELRKRLKLIGDEEATLLVTRQGKKEIAILAHRIVAPGVTDGHGTG